MRKSNIAAKNEIYGDNEEEKEIEGEEDNEYTESDNPDSSDSDLSSSGTDSDGNQRPTFIPRVTINAYKLHNEKDMKVQKGKLKFTKGTNPDNIQMIKQLIDENMACPAFLPMEEEDSIITPLVI